jgi:hypothetical protein
VEVTRRSLTRNSRNSLRKTRFVLVRFRNDEEQSQGGCSWIVRDNKDVQQILEVRVSSTDSIPLARGGSAASLQHDRQRPPLEPRELRRREGREGGFGSGGSHAETAYKEGRVRPVVSVLDKSTRFDLDEVKEKSIIGHQRRGPSKVRFPHTHTHTHTHSFLDHQHTTTPSVLTRHTTLSSTTAHFSNKKTRKQENKVKSTPNIPGHNSLSSSSNSDPTSVQPLARLLQLDSEQRQNSKTEREDHAGALSSPTWIGRRGRCQERR